MIKPSTQHVADNYSTLQLQTHQKFTVLTYLSVGDFRTAPLAMPTLGVARGVYRGGSKRP